MNIGMLFWTRPAWNPTEFPACGSGSPNPNELPRLIRRMVHQAYRNGAKEVFVTVPDGYEVSETESYGYYRLRRLDDGSYGTEYTGGRYEPVLIQLIYFVIYSIVFLIIGKLSFSEAILSPSFSSVRGKMTNACFHICRNLGLRGDDSGIYGKRIPQRTLCHRVLSHPVVYRRGSPVSDDGPAIRE